MAKKIFAEWDTKYKNDLPDSSFAYISPGGTKDSEGKTTPRSLRHLPYKDADGKPDLPHVRNALARLEHTDIPEDKKPAIEKKLQAILDKSKASEKCVGVIPLEFREDDKANAEDEGSLPTLIHLVPIGAWDHDLYGDIVIKASDIQEFVQNFNAKIRNGVFITAGHEGFSELPAVAWITAVEAHEDGLWGTPDWNSLGKEALTDKQYKFLSPEFYPTYEDPQSHIIYHNVLTGAALTKSPYFKELTALVMSDKIIQTNHQFSTMDLSTILGKKKSDLTQEEKGHIKKNKDKLSDAQLKEYKDIVGEDEDDNDADDADDADKKKASEDVAADEAAEAEKKAKEEASIAAGLNADGTKIEASEKVQISASELVALRAAADKGALAFKELEDAKITAEVSKMVFTASNKAGAFLPKEETDLKKFMATLKPEQRLAFSALISKVRVDKEIFSEKGVDSKAVEGTAQAELDAKVAKKMSENKDMKYSEALKIVMSENKGLEERYDTELPSSRRGKE